MELQTRTSFVMSGLWNGVEIVGQLCLTLVHKFWNYSGRTSVKANEDGQRNRLMYRGWSPPMIKNVHHVPWVPQTLLTLFLIHWSISLSHHNRKPGEIFNYTKVYSVFFQSHILIFQSTYDFSDSLVNKCTWNLNLLEIKNLLVIKNVLEIKSLLETKIVLSWIRLILI